MRRAALLLFIAFTACPKDYVETTTGAIGKAKSAAAAASARVNTSQENEIGIAECDSYIRNYEACLVDKVPEDKRESLRATLDQQRKRWQDSVTAGEDHAKIKGQCETEMESAKRALGEYGCAF